MEITDSPFPENSVIIFAEQTASTFARRRLMQVRRAADGVRIEIAFYTLKKDERFAKFSDRLINQRLLTASDIDRYECSLFYSRFGDTFVGSENINIPWANMQRKINLPP